MIDAILTNISRFAGVVLVVSAAAFAVAYAVRAWRDVDTPQVYAVTHTPTGREFIVNRAGGVAEVKEEADEQ